MFQLHLKMHFTQSRIKYTSIHLSQRGHAMLWVMDGSLLLETLLSLKVIWNYTI